MDARYLQAALIMSVGMLLIPFGDTAGKFMTSAGVAPLFVASARYSVGLVLLAPVVWDRAVWGLLMDRRIWLRGAFQTVTISTILTALQTEPIANVFGAFFLGPFVRYMLSVWLLKEQGSRARILLLLLGLGGVLLVVKPGFGMTPGLGWALVSGCFYGMFLTASRWVQPLGKPLHLLLAQLIIGSLLLLPFGIAHIPSEVPWGLMFWSGTASMFGNLFLIFAYARAGASWLAPFVYLQLIGAAVYGVLFFGDWPDPLAALGIAVIFASGFANLFLRTSRHAP